MITEAFEDDTGRYTCVASNSLGADNTSAEVYIEGQMFSYQEVNICFLLRLLCTHTHDLALLLAFLIVEVTVTAFVFVPSQELRHQTQKEKELCQSPDRESCLSTCVLA